MTELLNTSATPALPSSDRFPLNDRDSCSDYDEALFLLKNNPPEQRLDIHLPYSQYVKLEESWSKFKSENNISEERSLSYNSLMQIATVVTTQSALHDYTGAVFREIIASSVNEYLSIHEPRAIRRIKNYGSGTMTELSPYGKTSKEPDQSFGYGRPGLRPRLQVAIECGVKMDQYVAEAMANNLEQDKYGPIEYRSHIWLGKLDEVFVEVWRADGQQPVRKVSYVTSVALHG
ncbi:hypothetical protein V1522DRAFT_436688 [Lipomyces starkeyi]